MANKVLSSTKAYASYLNSIQLLEYGKTYREALPLTLGEILQLSSVSFTGSGRMTLHGELLMLDTSEYPTRGEESFLSQILEENVPDRYFLSENRINSILKEEIPDSLRLLLLSAGEVLAGQKVKK